MEKSIHFLKLVNFRALFNQMVFSPKKTKTQKSSKLVLWQANCGFITHNHNNVGCSTKCKVGHAANNPLCEKFYSFNTSLTWTFTTIVNGRIWNIFIPAHILVKIVNVANRKWIEFVLTTNLIRIWFLFCGNRTKSEGSS